MANQLKMAIVQSILSLHAQGWSGRRIALALEINRETVSRYLRQHRAADSKPANAPISPAGSAADSKPATALTGWEPAGDLVQMAQTVAKPGPVGVERAGPKQGNAPISVTGSGRSSNCAAWREFMLTRRAQGLSFKRIHQDLAAEPGAAAVSYDSVRRYLKRHAASRPIPFRRMECAPGQEAQVDFGSGAPIVANGKRRKSNVFRIVLSHSRKAYSESTYTQTTEDFIRCLENAFAHFGGVPKTLVIDNLKAAVAHRQAYDPIAKASYFVNTPGPCANDVRMLPYVRVRRPVYPLDEIRA